MTRKNAVRKGSQHTMKGTLAAIALALMLCGCGAGTAVPGVRAQTGTTTATFQVQIVKSVSIATAHARAPQYIAPETTFFLVDLQGNVDPQFNDTFTVNGTNCPPTTGPTLTCTFTANVPAGADPTTQRWSIAAGSGTKTDGSAGTPLSVVHNVAPCVELNVSVTCGASSTMPNTKVVIVAALDAVVASIGNVVFGTQNFTPLVTPPNPAAPNPAPYFTFVAADAFGNAVRGAYTSDAPIGDWNFADPFTIAEDDASGEVNLDVIVFPSQGFAADGPVSSVTFTTLAGAHGGVAAIRIDDGATAPRTLHVTYTLPAVTLSPSEFPQLKAPWTSAGASGTLLTLTCVPPASVPAGTNPCTSR